MSHQRLHKNIWQLCYNGTMKKHRTSNYIFELGTLKKFKHSGTILAGVREPDSIAEHVQRSAIIGYILAKAEKANAEKTAFLCLIHDNAETRITDLHKVAKRYIQTPGAEKKAYRDQVKNLPASLAEIFYDSFMEYENKTSKEGLIARDADMLETAFQAKEYLDLGYTACQDWISNVKKCLKTKSARKLLKEMEKTTFTDWWRDLKKIEGY